MKSTVELYDLELNTRIGEYGPDDVVPNQHLLDLILEIDPKLVFISEDKMTEIFDYDPLIIEIDAISKDGLYLTQERLMTLIVEACARFDEIKSVEFFLRKSPVLNQSGHLGVRLKINEDEMNSLRV